MLLRDYLFKYRLTKKEFAQKIGYSRPRFSLVMNGKVNLTSKFADSIVKETRGLVSDEEIKEEINLVCGFLKYPLH